MCGYGVAFGAIQLLPQIVPGLVQGSGQIVPLRKDYEAAKAAGVDSAEAKKLLTKNKVDSVDALRAKARAIFGTTQETVSKVQFWQELGGLVGRFALAYLAIIIISRRTLLRIFLIPALIIAPLVFFYFAAGRAGPEWSLPGLQIGIFITGFFIVGQMSFWATICRWSIR